MSATTPDVTNQSRAAKPVPAWIASGVLGLALGAGVMYLVLKLNEAPKTAEGGGPPAPIGGPTLAGGGMGGGGMGMGGGGMGGMGMGGMGMGGMGGGGGGGKRNLTTLIGKLELLSRADLKLQVELDAEQAKKIAAKLQELDKAEKMTADEAQSQLDALEALLTEDQKKTLGLIGLPFGRPGAGGGGRGAAGRPGAVAATGPGAGKSTEGAPGALPAPTPSAAAVPMMGMGMGGGNPDENPFTQEANQKRLRDLLARLDPSSKPAESPTKTEKPEAEKKETPKDATK